MIIKALLTKINPLNMNRNQQKAPQEKRLYKLSADLIRPEKEFFEIREAFHGMDLNLRVNLVEIKDKDTKRKHFKKSA